MAPNWKLIKPENEIDKLLYEFTHVLRSGYIEIGEDKICMPVVFSEIMEEIENMEVRDSDIFVMSHPKTGTTWCQEMVWMIYNLDYERGKIGLIERFPFLEINGIQAFNSKEFKTKFPNYPNRKVTHDSVNYVKEMKENPRFIKTHLHWELLPKEIKENKKHPKIIYVVRNPKDTCVSYYHHCRLLEGYNDSLENFCKLFLAGRLHFSPYWTHVLDFWKRKTQPNILFIYFEDMKKDLRSVILKVAEFLEKKLTNDDVDKLVNHLGFENMKNNPAVNNVQLETARREIFKNNTQNETFMRSGKVGGYKEEMSPEMIKKFDELTEKYFKNEGIVFPK